MLPLRARVDPGSNGNEGVLCIPQSSSTAGTSPSYCLVSYTRWVGVLPLCREAVGVFYSPSRLGKAGHPECRLGRQEIVYSAIGHFARVLLLEEYWPRLLPLPSRAAAEQASCFASWIESSSSWKPLLCTAMWYQSWTDRNIVFLYLLGIMHVVIWTTRKKELYDDESSQTPSGLL